MVDATTREPRLANGVRLRRTETFFKDDYKMSYDDQRAALLEALNAVDKERNKLDNLLKGGWFTNSELREMAQNAVDDLNCFTASLFSGLDEIRLMG